MNTENRDIYKTCGKTVNLSVHDSKNIFISYKFIILLLKTFYARSLFTQKYSYTATSCYYITYRNCINIKSLISYIL